MTRPAPLVPAYVDLQDFGYMPLDVVRLRDSDTAVLTTAEEFRAAVLLWCASWHQVPAGSLPNIDKRLADWAGYGRDVDAWLAVKEGALRGFVECDDGRLYHETVAEKALEAWEAKQKQRGQTAAATAAAKAKRDAKRNEERNEDRNGSRRGKRNGFQGKGREGRNTKEKIGTVQTLGKSSPVPQGHAFIAATDPLFGPLAKRWRNDHPNELGPLLRQADDDDREGGHDFPDDWIREAEGQGA